MNQSIKLLSAVGVIALLTLFVGCATDGTQTADLLSAAGFKPVLADTPQKVELLKTLQPGKISLIAWKGQSFYVQPDVANNRAMVGTPAEYQAYQQLRLAKQMSNDNLMAAEMDQASMSRWGLWGPGIYGGFYGRPFR